MSLIMRTSISLGLEGMKSPARSMSVNVTSSLGSEAGVSVPRGIVRWSSISTSTTGVGMETDAHLLNYSRSKHRVMRLDLGFVVHPGHAKPKHLQEFGTVALDVRQLFEIFGRDL